jgi:phosphoglycerate kinase
MSMAVPVLLKKRSFRTLPLQGRRVLVRVDFNVPLDKQTGAVTDDSRLRAALPTIEYLLGQKAKVILISHLGRPKGAVNPKYSLKPVVEPLSKLLHMNIQFAEDCIGPKAFDAVARLKPGEVLLLENLRFHAAEEKNNPVFGKELASLGDVFIQDAFGAVHRAHASTSLIPTYLESAAGSLLDKELTFLDKIKSAPTHPYVAILGGAKVSDKIAIVKTFIQQVDALFIGGAMAYTFLKAQGHEIGDSLFEPDFVETAKEILATAQSRNVPLLLPKDHKIVQDVANPSSAKTTDNENIPAGWKGVDVGPKTISALEGVLKGAKTVFWNGPSGIFEVPEFAWGTMEVAKRLAQVAKSGSTVVVGGGDSVAAVKKAGVAHEMTFISTGGGASMEFLEGQELPGVKALPDA